MTQRVELFSSKKKKTHRIEPFHYDPKNWIFFFRYDSKNRIFFFEKITQELNLFFCRRLKELNFFLFKMTTQSIFFQEKWLKEFNYFFFLNVTLRIDLFFWYDSKIFLNRTLRFFSNVTQKKLNFFLNVTLRIEHFFTFTLRIELIFPNKTLRIEPPSTIRLKCIVLWIWHKELNFFFECDSKFFFFNKKL